MFSEQIYYQVKNHNVDRSSKLTPQLQQKVWLTAVKKAGGKVPSSRIIKETVKEIASVNVDYTGDKKIESTLKEVNYQAGMGLEYTVKLDEATYNRLQSYQDKIGTASKNGAIARLLDEVNE